MILRVGIRGNGRQLADYLVELKDNDAIEILEVDAREDADKAYLFQTIIGMDLNSELTKTDKAFFHTQINPAYGEDQRMTREDWYKAADILAAETGYTDQRRVIVLHHKKGRTHAHVVWERYNHETGKMIDNKHSVLKADKARSKIEQALNHKQTPYRNPQRKELKEAVTELWNKTSTGPEFLKAVRKAGYMVASGTGNRPFMIVDENGRSFDLVRQLQGVRTKEVRARLRNEPLVTDKQAIEMMREQTAKSGKRDQEQPELKPTASMLAEAFAENHTDAVKEDDHKPEQPKTDKNNNDLFDDFRDNGNDQTKADDPDQQDRERKQKIAAEFLNNKQTGVNQPSAQELERQKIADEQERIRQRNRERKRSRFSAPIPLLQQIKSFFHDFTIALRYASHALKL